MPILIDCAQGSAEWLNARLGLATASNFHDILAPGRGSGESSGRRNLRHRLALERLTRKSPSSFETSAIRQGKEREPLARAAFEIETGMVVREVGLLRHCTLMAGASPDGLIGEDGGLEIKSPEPAAHFDVLRTGTVPSIYTAQVQGNLWISERRWWCFVSWNPDFPPELQLRMIEVKRDEAFIDRLRTGVEVFLREVDAMVDFMKHGPPAERSRVGT